MPIRPVAVPVRPAVVLVVVAMLAAACGGGSDSVVTGSGAGDGNGVAGSSTSADEAPTTTDDEAPTTESTTDDEAPTTTEATPSTSGDPDGEPDGDPDEDPADRGPEAWVGRYVWEEVADGGPGSNQVLVHELILRAPSGEGEPVTGRLEQNGFQTATEFSVTADPVVDGVAIRIVSVEAGLTSMEPGDVAVTLTGDPSDPLTTIGTLIPLVIDRPDSGRFFAPGR